MIADAHPARTVSFGEAINISIAIASKEEGQKIFDALAVGGKIDMPYALQFWGAIFGSVTDKFGVSWMVNAEQK
jgi:PhnB protein